MRVLAAVLLLGLAGAARADDAMPNRGDCAHPSCTCVDAEASHDCLDAAGCARFCADHGGVAQVIHSGYDLPPPRKSKKKRPAR